MTGELGDYAPDALANGSLPLPRELPTHCCSPAGRMRSAETRESLAFPGHAGEGSGELAVEGSGQHRLRATAETRHSTEQCLIPSSRFTMGDASGDGIPEDGELPLHDVTLKPFAIDEAPVTNAQFAEFVTSSGYVTDAERSGSSGVFHLLVRAEAESILGAASGTPWWIHVAGADWRHPGGPASALDGLADHPVTHVSWHDAIAYCEWAGRRLPTESEWECAARGGLDGARHPWGDAPIDGSDGVWRANVWQGTFPHHNSADDGWIGTAPVRSYEPNGCGLWQPIGNVWEWCADWFSRDTYALAAAEGVTDSPVGPRTGTERVLRGGSFLCHPSYCNRYRNSARSKNTPDSSMSNTGFRTVAL